MLKNINLASVVRIKAIGRRELALAVLAVLIVAALGFLPSVIKHYGIARQPLPAWIVVASCFQFSPCRQRLLPRSRTIKIS